MVLILMVHLLLLTNDVISMNGATTGMVMEQTGATGAADGKQ